MDKGNQYCVRIGRIGGRSGRERERELRESGEREREREREKRERVKREREEREIQSVCERARARERQRETEREKRERIGAGDQGWEGGGEEAGDSEGEQPSMRTPSRMRCCMHN
jgi:hypothetical protein